MKCVRITGPRDRGALCQAGPCEERQILVWWAKTGPEENLDGVSFGISAGETRQDRANNLGLATLNTKGSKPLGWSLVAW